MKKKSYQILYETSKKFGQTSLGMNSNFMWNIDPKKLFISMARYKFVSRVLEEKKNVLEIGGEPFRSRIVKQNVKNLTVYTKEEFTYNESLDNKNEYFKINFRLQNLDQTKVNKKNKKFDGIYALDFINKLSKKKERLFLNNCLNLLESNGIFILGTPSKESKKFASNITKLVNKNAYSGDELKLILKKYFNNVFLFSMNDEVVHTGFNKMAHYLIALCTNKKL